MQERNFTEILADANKNPFQTLKDLKPKMEQLAVKNEVDLQNKEVPDYLRIPTADELIVMRQYAIDYKKANPSDTKRQIRKAVQQHFKIRIYR